MAENTKIEWCDHTFNPWVGCTKVSSACDHCYAEAWAKRAGRDVWGAGKPRQRTTGANWHQPLRWNAEAERTGTRPRVFCASLADVFDNEVDPAWRADLFRLIAATPDLDWLLLTKRIGNVMNMVNGVADMPRLGSHAGHLMAHHWRNGTPPPNVWLGATVVNQAEADRDIPKLLATPAAKRFLSIEPMLGPINLHLPTRKWIDSTGAAHCDHCCNGDRCDDPTHYERGSPRYAVHCPHCRGTGRGKPIDWIIVGGESGPGARPMHPDWARSVRDQCQAAGVPYLFKQWGDHDMSYDRDRDDPDCRRCDSVARAPGRWINLAGGHGFNGERVHYAKRVGKKAAGRLLDGRAWDEFPA